VTACIRRPLSSLAIQLVQIRPSSIHLPSEPTPRPGPLLLLLTSHKRQSKPDHSRPLSLVFKELVLHLVLAEETQTFHIPDGLTISADESKIIEGELGWWLKVKREPWELANLLGSSHCPS
jgi:hypothetical protein